MQTFRTNLGRVFYEQLKLSGLILTFGTILRLTDERCVMVAPLRYNFQYRTSRHQIIRLNFHPELRIIRGGILRDDIPDTVNPNDLRSLLN